MVPSTAEKTATRAVVEEALAVEDCFEAARCPDLAEKLNDGDRIGGGDDGAEQKTTGPVESESVVGHRADQHHGQENANRRQQADRHDATPHLVEVECQRGLEDKARNKREQDQVGPDGRPTQARNETDQDSPHGQQNWVRDCRRPPGQQTQRRRGSTEKDEEEEKALRGAQWHVRTPADQPSRHTTR